MSHSILRVSRVKNFNDVAGLMKHIERTSNEYTNIDIKKTKTIDNYELLKFTTDNYNYRIAERLEKGYKSKRKPRSDAIRLVDGLITSDDAFFENKSRDEIRDFFEHSLDFLKEEYGADNLVYAVVHLDEKTPHLHFGFVPLTDDGRLSARDILGNKKSLSILQDKFNGFINSYGYDLKRGEPAIDTEKKHIPMNEYKIQTEYHRKELDAVKIDLDRHHERLNELNSITTNNELKSLELAKNELIEPERVNLGWSTRGNAEKLDESHKNALKIYDVAKNQQELLDRQQKDLQNLVDLNRKVTRSLKRQQDTEDERVTNKVKEKHKELLDYNASLENKILDVVAENDEMTGKYDELLRKYENLKEKFHSRVESMYYATKGFIKRFAANHFESLFNRFRVHYDDDLQEHAKTTIFENEFEEYVFQDEDTDVEQLEKDLNVVRENMGKKRNINKNNHHER